MLSIVDLIEAGTLTPDQAAYALAAIGRGASFMVGAVPGGAGKTTVMGALLNLVPTGARLVPADSGSAVVSGLGQAADRRCYICHEIGPGPYYAYLWGEPLRHYFALADAGHMLATNLHADTCEEAHDQICRRNGVPEDRFRRMNLIFFLSVERHGRQIRRRIGSIWESDGANNHVRVSESAASSLVTAESFCEARAMIERLLASGARHIDAVRAWLVREGHP